MTTRLMPQCYSCARLVQADFATKATCDAFPEGIPARIWENRVDHRKPVSGDHGIRFLSKDDEGLELLEALDPEVFETAPTLARRMDDYAPELADPKWTMATDAEGFLAWLDGSRLGLNDEQRVAAFLPTPVGQLMPKHLRDDLHRMGLIRDPVQTLGARSMEGRAS